MDRKVKKGNRKRYKEGDSLGGKMFPTLFETS